MAYQRLQHSGGAVGTTLTTSIASGDSALVLASTTGWPDGSIGPFYLVVDPGQAIEEKVLATELAGNTLTGCVRGVDGTTAATHTAGAVVVHTGSAVEFDEANQLVNQTLGTVAAEGDLVVASGPGRLTRLPVGANGLLLTASSVASTGLAWAQLGASGIAAGSIGTTQLAAGAVGTAQLAAGVLPHSGTYSGTTDGSARLVVTHGAAFTPVNVSITQTGPTSGPSLGYAALFAASSSTFTIQFVATTGSMNSVAVTGGYTCFPA